MFVVVAGERGETVEQQDSDLKQVALTSWWHSDMLISYQQAHIINRQTFENIAEAGLQVYSLVVEDKDTE